MTILVFPVWFTGCVGFCETLTEAQSSTSALPRSEERVCWQMSGAHHGYMDPASTDESATDETDEVNLQVLCLTGEGVTLRSLSLPRSMFGYDLRRLVSEKLPCKPGAKPAIMRMQTWLNQTLGEQGIVGKSAMLSCTYTYQPICTLHGVMYVGSQHARETLCSKA